MLLDWVSFLAYPNLFGIKGFVVVVCTDMRFHLVRRWYSKVEAPEPEPETEMLVTNELVSLIDEPNHM
jgi:hypothetical protein